MCLTMSSSVGGREGLRCQESKISVLIEVVWQNTPQPPQGIPVMEAGAVGLCKG